MDKALLKPDYYVNRELSWLLFNVRILDEARDKKNPLMERVKFLSITASNLDEFFMVRVASLHDMIDAGYAKPDLSGMTATKQLEAILSKTHDFIDRQYLTLNRSIIPLLEEAGIKVVTDYKQ
ncbi:MAG: RNA degradosome polyphosphate kinase, partial [Lachnospiraceae bacterium]|nr:RNA degradosome polyphosphate kinase [Lachnospiraceae bacterium]